MLTINFSPFPVIETERLVMRRIKTADVAEMFELRSNPRVMQYIDRPLLQNHQESIELIQKYDLMIDNNDGINWGIQLKGDTKLIGAISFHRIEKEHHRAEIGYLLHPDFHRRGLMNEAITAIVKTGFEQFQFHSIEARVNPENNASIQILEKNGFVKEGHFKENFYWNGKFLDTGYYSILRPKINQSS